MSRILRKKYRLRLFHTVVRDILFATGKQGERFPKSKERKQNMITFTMKADKSFVKSGDERTYRGEQGAQKIKIVLPHTVNETPISDCQIRLCFALGQSGDFAVLTEGETQSDTITYLYTVDTPLTQQAGIYRVWVEFWRYDGHLDAPSFCLKSETAEFFVLPHPHSQDLVTPHQLAVFTQLQKTVEAYLRDAQESAQCAESASNAAKTQADTAEKSALDAEKSAQDAADSALQAQVKKSIFLRYATNGQGTDMTENPDETTAFVGIAFSESAPADPSAYAWFLQDRSTTVHQGEKEIKLLGGGRIVCTKEGSIVLQPGAKDSNTAAHSYNFTTGVLNYNGGYAAAVCGYQNRANGSQQFIAGQNNIAPFCKNMAVVGQFCDSRLTAPNGSTATASDPKPLFAVGAGSGAGDCRNALTVYSNGEAVLQKEEERLPLYETLKLHSQLISQAIDAAGNEAYESVSVRIGKEKVTLPSEALPYAMINKIGAWSRPTGTALQAEQDLILSCYDSSNRLVSQSSIPAALKSLPDFGHGVGASLCNEVDLVRMTYTHSCSVYTFTGEETIATNYGVTDGFFCYINADYDGSEGSDLRARWNYGDVGIGDVTEKKTNEPFALGLRYAEGLLQKRATFYAPGYTATTLCAFLKERYENGTPIRMVYRKANPTVSALEGINAAWFVPLESDRIFRFAPRQSSTSEQAWARMQYQLKQEETV
jgi:hypothetical protein